MSIVSFVLGESGSGKSSSLRNLNPARTLLIQVRGKPLPFRSAEWKPRVKTEDGYSGNVIVTDNAAKLVEGLSRVSDEFDTVIIDDFQYLMSNEFMRGVTDEARGNSQFKKFNHIAKNAFDVVDAATKVGGGRRVYILAHTQTDESGRTKIKTIGKLLDEKIVLEGMVTMVVRAQVVNGSYLFSVHNSGSDTVKTPMGMFEEDFIDNDLAVLDSAICDYYGITQE